MLPARFGGYEKDRRQLILRPDGKCYVFQNGNRNQAPDFEEQPVSRTYQYRKVMKPMLERKRRARINRCLDELKELMLNALQSEGENVSKLEKADILELTVRHLHKLKRQRALGLGPETGYADRFLAGYTHCAAEVSQYMASIIQHSPTQVESKPLEPTIDHSSGVKLLQHLGSCIQRIEQATCQKEEFSSYQPYTTPPPSPSPSLSTDANNGQSVWRPW